jgi:PAS domain S-box-containing protein
MIASRRFAIDLGLGALAALAALLLKLLWPSVLGADPDALFLIPAAVCAWRRGFRSGAAALLCGAFVVGDLFLKDGFSLIDLQALSVFLLEGGAIIALVAFGRRRLDASERTAGQAQREFALLLDDFEEKYRLVVTNMPDVAWVTDASGMTKYVSENFETITGYTAAEVYEHTPEIWFGNIHPDDVPLVKHAFEALIRDGNLFDLEYRYQRRNGEWIWLHDRACTTYDVNGVPYAFGLFGDVTTRRKEQEELKQIQQLLAEAEKVTHVGSWSREISSGEVTWSDETYRILGLAAHQFDGTLDGMLRWIHQDDLETAVASTRAVERGTPTDVQLRFIRADGEHRIVCTHAELVTNQLGLPLRVVGTLKDITEQVEAEERERKLRLQLEEAQRLAELGRVAANIAHEVNNVLMAINPQAELADRAAPGNRHVQTAASRIRSAVTRGRRITEEILCFTHPHKPEVLRIDACQWLKGVIDEVRTLVPPGIGIVCDLPSEPVFIQGDQVQLQQVVLNLCSNASKAMAEGGVMTIGLKNTGSPFVDLTITDTGIGIAKGILPRIFEPLFTSGTSSGSGLGLALARQIVTQHGGVINAVSEPGRGSTFTVRLPRPDRRSEMQPPPMEPPSIEGACRRLLLVEDDDAVSSGLAALLKMEGIEVQIAREGRGVPRAIRDFSPDAIVLDVTLPDISGTVVFETIRREWPALPIIISTGQMCDPSIFALERHPHTEFLMKPYASAELMARIGRVVAG